MNITAEIKRMQQVIVSACAQEFNHKQNNIEHKFKVHDASYRELVTATDLKLSYIILSAARTALPQSYSEEELPAEPSTAELLWQIDPLDGTDEFAQGHIQFCGVTAALLSKQDDCYEPIAGIIYIPVRDLLISSDLQNSTVTIKEKDIDTVKHIAESQIKTQSPLRGYQRTIDSNQEATAYYTTIAQQLRVEAEIVQCGGAAHGFASLIMGEIDLFCFNYDYSKEWDVAAAQPIIECMGGFVCDLDGYKIAYNSSAKDHFNRQGFIASIAYSKEIALSIDVKKLLVRRLSKD